MHGTPRRGLYSVFTCPRVQVFTWHRCSKLWGMEKGGKNDDLFGMVGNNVFFRI
jgi:hypothetical protein